MKSRKNDITQLLRGSACEHLNAHLLKEMPGNAKKNRNPVNLKGSREKMWLKNQLLLWSIEKDMKLLEEHRFSPVRKFRFDFAWEEIMVALEYEGLFSDKSGHTTAAGYTKDTDKYNLAQELGWNVVRVTAINYKKAIQYLDGIYNRLKA